ncbi:MULTISPECIES: bifunctional diaminohydroxyphosphoribosylaminopyrimidine deaminase/5-amino-6-(5-phosphoribosylamino)uracil reductase RibD [Bacillaceae]|uniref:Riboflavin biosynthesis protein RibD n=1 Tax=Evansella alkalicola TaxID=745819 RepID=A0ABS6JZJ2_9BACI|nr:MULTISPECIES: bifunctional diaminohydroxyphosphoribosylaminopyrimidine deaminase/5-amino-6-(5-phosphoribosylamino)uracil reductase RibD [Bacillaceae]MBU9724022.1 bifunctional diaminohydroxyphosphoribosylaminopyrimidine deaminase/5-amino-6-(5-phosphoribosylamino)uracil reductase RibD [Bacillus alkalicola]
MDHHYMKMAIELAQSTLGQTTPNPAVGSVIVKNNQIVGMGAHLRAGDPHAERHALHMAGKKAEGATIYVTLEPCSHHGRTPPCADGLIEAGIKRVVIASVDPNPKVAGKGINKLRAAGITVETGVLEQEALQLNQVFFHYIQHKTPFVTLKSATSLDGKIATSSGESKWITGEEAREDVHYLRHTHDAILVGVNTVLEDDPSLTTRLKYGGKNPVRVILDSKLRTPVHAKLISDKEAETWIITSSLRDPIKKERLENEGVKIIEASGETIEIPDILALLGKNEITSVLVEGGGTVNDAFLRSGQFHQVITYMAPLIIGGQASLSSFAGLGIEKLEEAPKLQVKSIDQLGKDIKIVLSKGDV